MFLAFSRIFSGVIWDGQTVQVLSAAYSPARPEQERLEVQVSAADPHPFMPFPHSALHSSSARLCMRLCMMLSEASCYDAAQNFVAMPQA